MVRAMSPLAASRRPRSTTLLLLAVLALALPAAAVPPGSQVISDPTGDATFASPVVKDALDLKGVWIDSGSSTMTITFELVDLRDDQGPLFYGLSMLKGTTRVIVQCYLGDYGVEEFGSAVNATSQVLTEDDALVCRGGTQTSTTTSLIVTSITVLDTNSIHVPYDFDAAAETLTVDVPYSAFGGASGDTLSAFEARTCDGASIAVCTQGDDATGSGSYTLA